MDPVTASVIITGIKVGSSALVAKPGAELVKDFLSRILAPTGDALGEVVAHPITEWKRRVERASKIVDRAATLALEMGKEPGEVPRRILFRILEHSSVEENDDLAEHWAALLANVSMAPGSVPPSFVTILADLSPIDAKLLSLVHVLTLELAQYRDSPKNDESISVKRRELVARRLMPHLAEALGIEPTNVELCCDNLARLGLLAIWPGPYANTVTLGEDRTADLTPLGVAFISACTTRH